MSSKICAYTQPRPSASRFVRNKGAVRVCIYPLLQPESVLEFPDPVDCSCARLRGVKRCQSARCSAKAPLWRTARDSRQQQHASPLAAAHTAAVQHRVSMRRRVGLSIRAVAHLLRLDELPCEPGHDLVLALLGRQSQPQRADSRHLGALLTSSIALLGARLLKRPMLVA